MCLDLFQVAPVPFNFRKRPLNCRNLVVAYGRFDCILEGFDVIKYPPRDKTILSETR